MMAQLSNRVHHHEKSLERAEKKETEIKLQNKFHSKSSKIFKRESGSISREISALAVHQTKRFEKIHRALAKLVRLLISLCL